jgi:DNA helicase HerA-like ATPase
MLAGQRAVVLDVGSLDDARERSAIALAVLGYLRRREERASVLLVIDEAHNLLSPDADNDLQRAVTDYGVWIAGEGRKYGVHMLVSTQRPQKVHRNVLSQCDNLVLMRMNSKADIDELGTVFSHVPRSMIQEAKSFHQGEMLVAGPISTTPLRVRTAERWCAEGGADLPTGWASTGALATRVIMAAGAAPQTTKDGN